MLEGEFLYLNTKIAIWDMNNGLHLVTWNGAAEFITASLLLISCVTFLHSQEIKSYQKRKNINDCLLYVVE